MLIVLQSKSLVVMVKETLNVAVGSVFSFLTLVTPCTVAADYEKNDISSALGESLTMDNVSVDHSGSGLAVLVSGLQNQLQVNGYAINATAGGPDNSVVGVQVDAGGKV